MLTLLLISCAISSVYQGCYGQTIINVANGIYSTKAESDGLHLPSTSRFKPIDALTLSLYFTSSFSVFVNYQITVDNSAEFWSKLQTTRNDDGLTNAGSLVKYSTQAYKTATGYWMNNLEPGHYTFEVHYKSSSSISMSASTDYQAAILQVMWFTDARAVSDGVKCFPLSYRINTYDVLNPIKDLKVNLHVPGRVVIAGYQLSIQSASSVGWFTARMHKNNQQLTSTIMTQGRDSYYSINSLWMKYQNTAEYEFGVTYRNNYYNTFIEDCQGNHWSNKQLYAMYLPSRCRILANVRPTSSLSLSSTAWKATDLSYLFTLHRDEHIFVRYQFTAPGRNTFTITRLAINSVPMKHTASITGNENYAGNSGMWQGVLSSGRHNITVEHKSGSTYTHYIGDDLYTRAMDIIACY